MGGGNAQKSAIARARNQKDGEKQGSQLKMNAAAANIKCKICMVGGHVSGSSRLLFMTGSQYQFAVDTCLKQGAWKYGKNFSKQYQFKYSSFSILPLLQLQ